MEIQFLMLTTTDDNSLDPSESGRKQKRKFNTRKGKRVMHSHLKNYDDVVGEIMEEVGSRSTISKKWDTCTLLVKPGPADRVFLETGSNSGPPLLRLPTQFLATSPGGGMETLGKSLCNLRITSILPTTVSKGRNKQPGGGGRRNWEPK